MTVADIKASGEALERAHVELVRAGHELEELLRTLDTKVDKLRGAWSGDASDAYERAQREWTALLEEMRRLVADYGRRVHEVDDRYREASRTISQKIWR
ncbi:WXG100 family type VII secretion target [Agromyces atrinae]|jgi:WXG100 family type VII secretion target|uniref:WXG100 family type VII secretion target n=1 Tax=Agromyces atrinae TaxID=592376 RepID=UPI001F5931B2|nr:WXG100 family type VII secretion target [Agromyces atrinae]MCI2959077.1 WXG100 family type VII secretion target [Agromyces atrinae]